MFKIAEIHKPSKGKKVTSLNKIKAYFLGFIQRTEKVYINNKQKDTTRNAVMFIIVIKNYEFFYMQKKTFELLKTPKM